MSFASEVFSKEYLGTIRYLFVISINILARGLEFRLISKLMCQPASPPRVTPFPPVGKTNFGELLKEDEIRVFQILKKVRVP